jgi:hypothetical protein
MPDYESRIRVLEEENQTLRYRVTALEVEIGTAYLENGGTIENAQLIAAHESPRTTKLYDRTGDEITLDEVEWIAT